MSVEQARTDGPESSPSALRRVVGASMAGTVVEWYEFFLYGTAATLVFAKVFFPDGGNELDAIIAAFVTYAVASSPGRSVGSSSATSVTGSDASSCCRPASSWSASRPS